MSSIDLHDVSIRLGNATIVRDNDLAIPSGAFVAVVGPNGSGKTTLVRAVYRAIALRSGTILIDGHDMARMPVGEAARLRAVVPQFHDGDIALTVAALVGTGRHAAAPWWAAGRGDERVLVDDALRRAGAEALSGRVFGTLSGGERQRVLLARALVQDATTLLLDEPTNHLDARAQLELLEMLSELPLTRVAVLHDLDHALAYADLVAVMHEGRLVASGPPAEVLTNELTSSVFGVRSTIMSHPLTGRSHLLTAPLATP